MATGLRLHGGGYLRSAVGQLRGLALRGDRSSISSDTLQTLLLRTAGLVLAFVGSAVISRWLGPTGRGEYSLPAVTGATIAVFCSLGFEHANVYLLGSDKWRIEDLSAQNGLIAGVMGVLGGLLVMSAPRLLPHLFESIPPFYLVLVGLSLPFSLHATLSAGLLALKGEVKWQPFASILGGLLQVGLVVALAMLHLLTPGSVLGTTLVSAIFAWGLIGWMLEGRRVISARWNRQLLRESLCQSLWLYLAMTLLFLHLRVDMFMVKAMAGTAALGIYSVSVSLAETIGLATDSLGIAILPRQIGNSLGDAAQVSLRAARANILIAAAIAAGWAVIGWPVIRLGFGRAFVSSYLPLVLLLPAMVFTGMQRVCGGAVIRSGTPVKMVGIYAISLALNVILNLWWIPRWGAAGASLASTVSYGVSAILFVLWTTQLADERLSAGLLPRAEDVALLSRGLLSRLPLFQRA